MSTAPNTDVVDGGTTRDETGTARDEGTVAVTQSPVSRSRSVLVGVALSSAAVILVVVGLWIGLGSSGSESDESPGAGVNAGASDLAVLLTRVSQAVGSEQWDEAIKTCARLTGDAKTNAEANCAKARMEKEASGHFEAEHRASLRNEYEEVLLEHAKIPRESVYKKRDLHVVENARFKYMPQAMRILDDLVEAGDCEQARRVAGRIKELDPSNTDAEQKVARCGVAGAWPETEQPAAPTVAQIQQAKTLLKQARTSYVAGKHAYSIQQAKQVLKLVPGNPDAIQIVGAASCYLKQAGQAKWAYDRLRPAVRNLVRNICIRNGINLE